MSRFWETFSPVVRSVSNAWNNYLRATNGGTKYETLQLPSFSVVDIPFVGASYTLLEFPYVVGGPFTLVDGILKPTGDLDYCLAIRFGESPNITRYKLWTNGEVLSYPLYEGQVIPASFVLEVWNVYIRSTVTQLTPLNFRTSRVLTRESCCNDSELIDVLPSNAILFEPMNPDAALPFVPSEAFHYP